MLSVVVHGAGWAAIPLIVLVGIGYLALASRHLGQPAGPEPPPTSFVRSSLRFAELYAVFGVGPLAPERWPVLQSGANRSENANLARFRQRPVRAKRVPR